MRWFSHQHRSGRRLCPRGQLLNTMPHFFVFCPWWPLPLTLTFELGRDFCTMHLTAKFHHPTFNHSEVILQKNTLTNWQTNRCRWKNPPRSAMLRWWVITDYIWETVQDRRKLTTPNHSIFQFCIFIHNFGKLAARVFKFCTVYRWSIANTMLMITKIQGHGLVTVTGSPIKR